MIASKIAQAYQIKWWLTLLQFNYIEERETSYSVVRKIPNLIQGHCNYLGGKTYSKPSGMIQSGLTVDGISSGMFSQTGEPLHSWLFNNEWKASGIPCRRVWFMRKNCCINENAIRNNGKIMFTDIVVWSLWCFFFFFCSCRTGFELIYSASSAACEVLNSLFFSHNLCYAEFD